MTTPIPAQIECYKGYDDPTVDMVLEVNGGQKFRVHSYLLKSHSQFFRSMPEHDDKLCGNSAKEIFLDAESADLAVLLDIIDRRPSGGSYLWSEIVAVIELGEKYQFIHLNALLIDIVIVSRPGGNPWTFFEVASKYGLVTLAKQAILDFDITKLYARLPDEVRPSEMEGVTGPFAIALLSAMRRHVNSQSVCQDNPITGRNEYLIKVDWPAVSNSFKLE